MSDQIVRAITKDGMIQASAIISTALVEKARNIHKTLPVATAALGRALTAASFLGNSLKIDEGSVTLQIKGGGPLGTVLAVSDSHGNVRGYVQNPGLAIIEKYQGKLDVGTAVGTNGQLTVIRDLNMKEPYIGSVNLVSGEIAEDIAAYFVHSEQIPTACALGVYIEKDQSVSAAGGYLIQLMPGADEGLIDKIEDGIKKTGAVTGLLRQKISAQDLLYAVLDGFELDILEQSPIEYRCYCSRKRVSQALISLGTEELNDIAAQGEVTEVGCQFCDVSYRFTPEDIRGLIFEIGH